MITVKRPFPRGLRRAVLPLFLTLVGTCVPATAQAAAPALKITSLSSPTHFVPGAVAEELSIPRYIITVTNTGGAPTDGSPITVTDTLPAGLSLSHSAYPPLKLFDDRENEFSCEEGPPITCVAPSSILRPGMTLNMYVPVNVESSASGTVVNQVSVSGGGVPDVSASESTLLTPEPAGFGFQSLETAITASDGAPFTQAGGHPYQLHTEFQLNSAFIPAAPAGYNAPAGSPRNVVAKLPPGMVVNPHATAERCTEAQFEASLETECPDGSVAGLVHPTLGVFGFATTSEASPLYNLVPPPGYAAAFGFNPVGIGIFIHLLGGVDSVGDYVLTATSKDIPQFGKTSGIRVDLWGNPSDPSHDFRRGICVFESRACPTERVGRPLLTMPSSCSAKPLTMTIGAESWQEPGKFVIGSSSTEDEEGNPIGVDGCNKLQFEPTITSLPTTNRADSPTGLDFNLHQPQAPLTEQAAGQTDACSTGSWSNNPSEFAYQWLRNGVAIEGATNSSYLVSEADAGSVLQCEVIATNPAAAGPGHAASTAAVINPAPPTSPPAPATPLLSYSEETETATCSPGGWSGEPSFAYRWLKDGAVLAGETEETLEISPAEAPFTLQCEVLGTNAGGTVVAYSSNRTSEPPSEPPLPESTFAPQLSADEAALPLGTAILKDAKVTLPAGMTLNPSAGNGLDSCSEAQIGYQPKEGKIHFSEVPQSCPDAAKVGTLEVSTPLLDEKLEGAVYVAKPYQNPFGSLLAIFLAIESKQRGIVAKLAGEVQPDPNTGQLTAVFKDNPQLPIEDVDLHFFKGPRAPLRTPATCGEYTTTSTLVPWSTPEGADAHPSDSFETSVAAAGSGACPTSEATAPNKPSFTAGTIAPQAAAYSPFVLRLTREDGSQRLTGLDATLPKGLTGKLAGIPYCSEAQIAQAKSREAPNQGAVEQSNPSCPSASEVGSVTVGAGAGITPLYVTGHAYLAGPYKGAPLSLVIITPAVAGPFDLGAVVVRTALYVNPETAQIHAVSDPLPSIIQGIPLDLRSVALKLDRPSFTLNPTSCDPAQITGQAAMLTGQSSALTAPFQVGGCNALGFKPKLAISLKGGTKRNKYPALKAVVTYPQGGSYANIARAQVTLPHSEFLEQGHIGTICTRVQFAADQCPARSIYGKARAFTPLLDKPLEGPVYLRSSSRELPDLVAALRGQVDVDLIGKVDTGSNDGIRNTFEAAPDAPVSKFVLEMQGGKKGLLVNSENICRKAQKANASFTAHNGKTYSAKPLIKNDCGKKGRKHKKHKRGG